MKHNHLHNRIFQLLITGSLLAAAAAPLMANPSAECRTEAEEYAIPPEQVEDYVRDCILSRGGELVPVAGEVDMPLPGTDEVDMPVPGAGEEDMPPPQPEDMSDLYMPAEPLQ